MKQSLILSAVLALAVSSSAFAASHKEAPAMATAASAPMTTQQSKMGNCNKEAADKKGDERKAFMKTCLSAGKPTTQQSKMKQCNVDAAGKKGDERKAFMKECLSA
jgi:psiF repeat-containing protein